MDYTEEKETRQTSEYVNIDGIEYLCESSIDIRFDSKVVDNDFYSPPEHYKRLESVDIREIILTEKETDEPVEDETIYGKADEILRDEIEDEFNG